MFYLLKTFWNLLFFRASPQAVPYSLSILGVLLLSNFSLKLSDFGAPYFTSAIIIIIGFVWLAVFLWGCLSVCHHADRFIQTYIAIMGVLLIQMLLNSLLDLVVPVSWMPRIDIAILIWGLTVLSHIFRYALEIRVSYAVLLVIVFEVLRLGLLWTIAGIL